ncbi:PIG-L family deacetylase [Kineosporia rhizophila]|uniref:PIG-L deacetylase family protein n=1 Tax=Kineosporia TaxID=49184 RepID=UPI000A7CD686|nr:PIG-L family deacetylase [Kineosporia sp. NBRC 101677]MCE0534813.1 PIG-L family deacetylase [Kineosporia rhizophila]GLY19258.1 GlcNAc-PI de-N-acetylase [Kineosporia sp. NBRC 101677]
MIGADALQDHASIIILSPHLDDAALSCGSLIAQTSPLTPVTVMTLFSSCNGQRPAHPARAFLRQSNARRAQPLYSRRRAEDKVALRSIGATGVHFGFQDALFRRRKDSRVPRLAARWLPELDCVYPTQAHMSRGRIAEPDQPLLPVLEQRVSLATTREDLILAPLGRAGHVDHVITHELGKALSGSRTVGWYAEQPGVLREGGNVLAPEGTERVKYEVDHDEKAGFIGWYGSQLGLLFGGKSIPDLEEYVFLPVQ